MLSDLPREPPALHFALIGGPSDYRVFSDGWARVAFGLANRVLRLQRRSDPEAFGFIYDVDYRYGPHGPIRRIAREASGRWPKSLSGRRDLKKRPGPTWYLAKFGPWQTMARVPAVFIWSRERVFGGFDATCAELNEAVRWRQVSPVFVVLPDGPGGRAFGERIPSERDALAEFLPNRPRLDPVLSLPEPALSSVISGIGERIAPQTFLAVLQYLEARHQSALSPWQVLADPLILSVASSQGGASQSW